MTGDAAIQIGTAMFLSRGTLCGGTALRSRMVCARANGMRAARKVSSTAHGKARASRVAYAVKCVSIMKRILVCLDASPRAPFVLATAVDLAGRIGARLCLLRAVGLPPEIDQEVLARTASDVIETMMTKAKFELETLAKAHSLIEIEGLHVHVGTPWDTICREATSLDCDLVMLGSHGYSGFDRILGTTAAKVVNHCDRSVFVVRPLPARRS